jgi:hypothetical protein
MSPSTFAARAARPAAVAAAVGCVGYAGFQVALALGAPLGRAAWGGTHVELPTGLRIASGGAAVVWILAALVVLGGAGYRVSPASHRVSHYGTWGLVGLLALSALMNAASGSNWERFLQAPLAFLLALLCFVVARGGAGSPAATPEKPARALRPARTA